MGWNAGTMMGRREGTVPLRGRLLRLAVAMPTVAMFVSVVALVVYCRALLQDAAAGREVVVGEAGFWLSVGGFLLTSLVVFVFQVARMAARVAGPEFRLRRSLQRIRSGDLGFRVELRRGDLLGGLAEECNLLVEWLARQSHAAQPERREAAEVRVVDQGSGKP